MSDFTAGVYADVPEDDYHSGTFGPAEGSLSASGIKTILKAPAKYRWELEHPKTTDALDVGTCVHTELLGTGQGRIVVPATGRTKVEQTAHREAKEAAAAKGLIPVSPEQDEQIRAMVAAVRADRAASRLLAGEWQAEVSAYALDEPTGIWRRCRYDILRPALTVDLKTARTASPHGFARACHDFGYHISAAYYLDIAQDLGLDVSDYAFLVVEKEPPYLVGVYRLDDEAIELGRREYRRGLERFRDCTETDRWPGYAAPLDHTLSLPGYAYTQESA